jgi:hypothetical protein
MLKIPGAIFNHPYSPFLPEREAYQLNKKYGSF